MSQALLIVVHPGSLCGSADFHLGYEALRTRERIAAEILSFPGRVAVIEGDFDDELRRSKYRGLRGALQRAEHTVYGAPFKVNLTEVALALVRDYGITRDDQVCVTGAWNDSDGSGCCNTVAQAIARAGISCRISANAPAADGREELAVEVEQSSASQRTSYSL